jgi:diguanylate cyclase (GGDEF)-like protein
MVALIHTDIIPAQEAPEANSSREVETAPHVLRARRTAACTRAVLGVTGIVLLISQPGLLAHPALGIAGFATITTTAMVQLSNLRHTWLTAEESLAGAAAVLIVGMGDQRVTVLSLLWLAAVASGVMARGGRVHWIGRTVVLSALVLPVVRLGYVEPDHAALCVAAIGLLLTSGRLTRELNALLTQARYDADHDDLTGVLSSAAFRGELARMTRAASASRPVALLLVDLDGFGAVNKTLGHAAGDAVLARVGERLREVAGPASPVGRLGGDEFALVVADGDAQRTAARLVEALGGCGEATRRISACVGIASSPGDGNDADALMRASDIALRVAKRISLGGRVARYEGESLSGDGRQSARYSLTKLIEGDGLVMVVQPIVDLRASSVHAYEALARFGPGGTGSPLHWFAVAEEFGERDALERACLREALELFSQRAPGCRMSVNLSAPVLLDPRTLQMLETPHDLTGLIIEVTEEVLVQSDAQLQAAIGPLQERGACLAVDDMGAGYSGLRQITTVHPSYLKLDRSLITGIDRDHDRAALVRALVGYADHVGSLLVAEGIETDEELQTLLELGVPLGQGFYLGRPGAPWPGVSIAEEPPATLGAEKSGSTTTDERERKVGWTSPAARNQTGEVVHS